MMGNATWGSELPGSPDGSSQWQVGRLCETRAEGRLLFLLVQSLGLTWLDEAPIFHVPSLSLPGLCNMLFPGTEVPFLLTVMTSYSFFKFSLGICPSRKPQLPALCPFSVRISVLLLPFHLLIPLPLVEMRQPEGPRQCFALHHTHSTLVKLTNDISQGVEYSWATTGLKATQGSSCKSSHFVPGYWASAPCTGKPELGRADLTQWLASPLVWIANSAICSTVASPPTSPNQPTSLPSSSLRADRPASH